MKIDRLKIARVEMKRTDERKDAKRAQDIEREDKAGRLNEKEKKIIVLHW